MYLTQGVHRALSQTPDLPATIFGDRMRTWRESAERVARLAAGLRELGVASGDRVAILALNSDIYHEVLLAVPWADAVVVPANTRWSTAEIGFSLADSGTSVLIVDDAFTGMVSELREIAPCLRVVLQTGAVATPEGALDLEAVIASHAPAEDARRGGSDLAGIYYTGGTTAKPKGVMLSHASMMTSALGTLATGLVVAPGGRYLHAAPMFHLADGLAWVAQNAVGGTHVIVPGFTAEGMAAAVERHRVTHVLLVPTMIQMLVDDPAVAEADLSSLRGLTYGASPISEALLERAEKRLPTTDFVQVYGMTELSPLATILGPADHFVGGLRRSAGRAAPHVELRIVDSGGRELPPGTIGEIACRGGHVMLGYWNRPEETAAVLREGWMHTGDSGFLDERGYLFVVDRLKDMIVSGGENVYSVEVENALASHPGVAACAVIGVPDAQWGERVHAIVVAAPGTSPCAGALRAHVRRLIAGYKAPRSVDFVEALPLSGAGKILKRELRAPYWAEHTRGVS